MVQHNYAKRISLAVLGMALALSVSGCAVIGQVLDDMYLADAEEVLCKDTSIESIVRNYSTPEAMNRWRALCVPSTVEAPATVLNPLTKEQSDTTPTVPIE